MMCLRLCQLLICIAIVASYRSQSRNFLRMRVNSFQPLSSCPSIPEIQFFNTLTRRKEKFQAMNAPKVSFYTCGPTVYDYAHIGNFRAFLTYDLIKRWLQYCGYDVDHVCNLTDVDDKIIVKMISEGLSLMEVTNKYANAFMDDLKVIVFVTFTYLTFNLYLTLYLLTYHRF